MIMCTYSIRNVLCTLYVSYMLYYYIVYDNMNIIYNTIIIIIIYDII